MWLPKTDVFFDGKIEVDDDLARPPFQENLIEGVKGN